MKGKVLINEKVPFEASSRKGIFECRLETLKKLFGDPMPPRGNWGIRWRLLFEDGAYATIYESEWKGTTWAVGGRTDDGYNGENKYRSVHAIKKYISENEEALV